MATKFRVTVTELPTAEGAPPEQEVFKIVIDSFDPVEFTKAITARKRARRRPKQDATS